MTIDKRLLSIGDAGCRIVKDDFTGGGAYASGAASIPTATVFGEAQWRCLLVNGAPSITYTATGQSATHEGIIDVSTGTNAAGVASAVRLTLGGLGGNVLGTGQFRDKRWIFKVPVLSDGTNTFLARLGEGTGANNPADAIYLEMGSGNFLFVARLAGVNTPAGGGSALALAADTWYTYRRTWDGTTLRAYVTPEGGATTFLGSVAAGIPTGLALGEFFAINKSLGATPRSILIDDMWHKSSWNPPRGT